MVFGFIVEGFNDEIKIRSIFPKAEIVVTKGTRFRNRTRMDIVALLKKEDQVFLLTDPDPSGDKLVDMISAEFHFPRISLDTERCICYRGRKLKIGVEHADDVYLKGVIEPILEQYRLQNYDKNVNYTEQKGRINDNYA